MYLPVYVKLVDFLENQSVYFNCIIKSRRIPRRRAAEVDDKKQLACPLGSIAKIN